MIIDFGDKSTEDIYDGNETKEARRLPKDIWQTARRKLDMLNAAHDVRDLRVPPGNRLERLKGKMTDFYSIRINDQFRLVFKWKDGNAKEVQIVDYH